MLQLKIKDHYQGEVPFGHHNIIICHSFILNPGNSDNWLIVIAKQNHIQLSKNYLKHDCVPLTFSEPAIKTHNE